MAQAFVHLSDPHLTSLAEATPGQLLSKRLLGYLSWRRRRRAEHRREVLDALVADFAGDGDIEQIVLTGDLTHVGLESEFREAAAWLAALAAPERLALVPGNHDATVGESIALQADHWGAYLAGDEGDAGWPTLRVRGDLAFIGLDSAVATAPGLASGRLSETQLQRLPSLLADCRQRGLFRVIYVHHCPLPGVERRRKCLVNAAAAAAALAEGGVELVLHGHGHRDQRHALETIDGTAPVIAAPSASARGLGERPAAAYHRLTVARRDGGWDIALRTRGVAGDGLALRTLREETLALSRSR